MSSKHNRSGNDGGQQQPPAAAPPVPPDETTEPTPPPKELVGTGPWPPDNGVEIIPDPKKDKDPLQEARRAAYRIKLACEMMVRDLDLLLNGPLAGPLRQAAVKERHQMGPDGRQWPPLNVILRTITHLKPVEED